MTTLDSVSTLSTYQEERTGGRWPVDSVMTNGCHRWSVPELSALPVRMESTSFSVTRAVSRLLSVISKLNSLSRRIYCVSQYSGFCLKVVPWKCQVFGNYSHQLPRDYFSTPSSGVGDENNNNNNNNSFISNIVDNPQLH